jgi:hypothetical protein
VQEETITLALANECVVQRSVDTGRVIVILTGGRIIIIITKLHFTIALKLLLERRKLALKVLLKVRRTSVQLSLTLLVEVANVPADLDGTRGRGRGRRRRTRFVVIVCLRSSEQSNTCKEEHLGSLH